MKKHDKQLFFDINDLAEILNMSPGTIRNRISQGASMPISIRVGRKRLWPIDEFEKWKLKKIEASKKLAQSEEYREELWKKL